MRQERMRSSLINSEVEMTQAETGTLCLISNDRAVRQQLTASVYRNTPNPFAVFTREGRRNLGGRNQVAYLALNDCEVKPLDERTFMFASKKERVGKGPSYLIFETNSKEERDKWVDLLKCDNMNVKRTTRRSCAFLPTIKEYEDTEEVSPRITPSKVNLISV